MNVPNEWRRTIIINLTYYSDMREKQIQAFNLVRLRNYGHFLFVTDITTRAKADPVVVEKAGDDLTALCNSLEQEDKYVTLSQKSLKSDKIAALDEERDGIILGLKKTLLGFLELPVEDIAEAAEIVWQAFVDYDIDPKMQRDLETGALINLINDLETKYADQVSLLGISVFVAKLKDVNERLRELTEARLDERMAQTVGALRAARKVTDDDYRNFVTTINAHAWLEGDVELGPYIDYLNAQILHYRRQVLGQKGQPEEGLPEEDNTTTPDETPDEGDGTPEGGETPAPTPDEGGTDEGGGTDNGGDDDEEVVG